MNISFSPEAWEDFTFWVENDRKVLAKLLALLRECQRTPFSGLGKPEPLRGELKGYWSRRINQEHRLVYKVSGGASQELEVVACRYHYG
jgi:toxin YoeB